MCVFNLCFFTLDILRIICIFVCFLGSCQCITVMPDIGIFHSTYSVPIGITGKMELKSAENSVYFKSLLYSHDLNQPICANKPI